MAENKPQEASVGAAPREYFASLGFIDRRRLRHWPGQRGASRTSRASTAAASVLLYLIFL